MLYSRCSERKVGKNVIFESPYGRCKYPHKAEKGDTISQEKLYEEYWKGKECSDTSNTHQTM